MYREWLLQQPKVKLFLFELKIAIVKALGILITKSDTEPQTSKEGVAQDMT
jgi:hypothetical protein